jgi:AAHS family 4-hydroxybenzoate transporter-like MFS transporter
MPHVRRSMLIWVEADSDRVRRALTDDLELVADGDALTGPIAGMPDTTSALTARVVDESECATQVELVTASDVRVPFFTWFLRIQAWLGARRALPHAADRLTAAATGGDPPDPLKPLPVVPPVAFTAEQATRLAALSAVALVANFSGALLSQNGDAVTSAFGQSDQALGVALAVARAGVLVSLVAIALADRWGRRRLILLGLVGACAANLLTAFSPTFEVFTGAQLLNRALVNTVLIVAGIAAVEDAPEGARAFATGMYALALGAGFGLAVVLLPFADLGDYGWRISFALSAALVLLVPVIAPHLKETTRYVRVADRSASRGRVRELFDRAYGARFLLLGLAAFLTNVFSAPSSQLTNRYLTHAHDFSNSDVAVFRAVTAGVPGLIGVLLASRLAESRGRRPVTVVGLLVATGFQAAFFLANSALVLWITPVVAIIAAACAGLALGTLDAELFPTEVRGTSSGFLLVSGVVGSAVGLVLATQLTNFAGGLGPAIALCGIASVVAAIFVVPKLPETADRRLDDVSPSEL